MLQQYEFLFKAMPGVSYGGFAALLTDTWNANGFRDYQVLSAPSVNSLSSQFSDVYHAYMVRLSFVAVRSATIA